MRKLINKIKSKLHKSVTTVQSVVAGKRAEGYIDTAVKIIIGVVIGGVLLAGLMHKHCGKNSRYLLRDSLPE